MENVIYIHYGSKVFNPEKGFPIENESWLWTKPKGHTGLWASRENASFGWKDWCESEDFRECSEEDSFKFKLKEGANVVYLHTEKDILKLPLIGPHEMGGGIFNSKYIDFEKCVEIGIDVIELAWYGDEWKSVRKDNLHYALYGWDCDCILILNPDIVEVL